MLPYFSQRLQRTMCATHQNGAASWGCEAKKSWILSTLRTNTADQERPSAQA